jgi:hypothetical protein
MFEEAERLFLPPQMEAARGNTSLTSPPGEGDLDGWCLEWYYSEIDTSTCAVTEFIWLEEGYYWWDEGDYYNHLTGRLHRFTAGYSWHGTGWSATTKYNQGMMFDRGAGPNDWADLYRHERAHQVGWLHGEGTPEVNGAYYCCGPINGN